VFSVFLRGFSFFFRCFSKKETISRNGYGAGAYGTDRGGVTPEGGGPDGYARPALLHSDGFSAVNSLFWSHKRLDTGTITKKMCDFSQKVWQYFKYIV
jgi:hypothetical protein